MPKKKKDFSGDPGGLIGDVIWSATKPLYKEAKRQERARRAPRRTYYAPEPKVSQKRIVFSVLRRGIANAGTNFSRRDLYYAARPLVYAHAEWEDGKRLEYNYFSQTLLTEYQEQRGAIAGLWTDPRGITVSTGHVLAAKPEVSIAEMIEQPTFDFPVADPVFRDYWMAINHRGGRPPRIAAQFRSLDGLLQAVRGGLGVNLIRERIVDTLGPNSGVVFRPVRGLEPAEISLAWAEGNTSQLVADFVAAARDAFSAPLAERFTRL